AQALEAAQRLDARRSPRRRDPRRGGAALSGGARPAAARRPSRHRADPPARNRGDRVARRRGARGARGRSGFSRAGDARRARSRRGAALRRARPRTAGAECGLVAGDARAVPGTRRRRPRREVARARAEGSRRRPEGGAGGADRRDARTRAHRGDRLAAARRAAAQGRRRRLYALTVQLYNTLTRRLDELPAPPGPVRMYFCGPTVYARAHVGNARPYVIGMWLHSWLRSRGYEATLVHNITDVNDKIYDAAPGKSAELAARATEWYLEDTGDLGLGMPDELPKATEHIPQIVRFIEELIERGHAYSADGDVYFRVASDSGYGALSGRLDAESARNPSEEQEPGELKEDPRDFALWKAQKEGEDTSWES